MSDDELVNLKRMWNKTFDQLETENIEGLSDRRHEARIKEYQEKNYIVLSRKEVAILRGRIPNASYVLLLDLENTPEYFEDLNKTEIDEFKIKLGKLIED